ncbi:TonB C-terminal domain-containing protein [Persicimonas caeni]|uniref:TonB C-terminal domain-containing protein n=1 Tax=Persicimonas caeni TaxID=2292766 RepID=A0A4Y6Q151_PERCE|nr:TonB C-terminal domain-containing protein [Persicimonas caeni]QDG54304.1 TonB C-terminal domain-containing protein [Persicimonas caeni]QED35525.1 TonB C-terminal domain-containing protein [Persicimonas caeni]
MRDLNTQIDPGRRGPYEAREPNQVMMIVGIITSILLHGSLVGMIVWGTMRGGEDIQEEIEPKMLEFENVELLALGEKKPPNQLPRMANPAPPEVKEDAVNLAKPKEKPPEQKPEEKEEEKPPQEKPDKRKELLKGLENLHNPNRPINTDVPEGSEQGVAQGTITDAAMANLMGTYQAKLLEVLGKYWSIPSTLSDAEINELAGTVAVYVRLSDSGHVVSYRFRSRSANDQFNASIDRLMRRFQVSGGRKLPVPNNPEVRKLVLKEGLNLKNWKAITGR